MVVGAFPAAKLGALLLKQISKPIANALKEQAKKSPVFRKYVCMPPAQFYNWCEVKTKMWILNLGKPVNIPVLNEAMAIELGANLLGEGVIFLIAAGILIAEYTRSSMKESSKEQMKVNEMQRLQSTIMELYLQTEQQATQIRELNRYVTELDSKVVKKPWMQSGKDAIDTEPQPPILPIVPLMDDGVMLNEGILDDSDKKGNEGSRSNPPKSPPPPPPPMATACSPNERRSNSTTSISGSSSSSIVLGAIRDLQDQFLGTNNNSGKIGGDNDTIMRRPSVLTDALNHLL